MEQIQQLKAQLEQINQQLKLYQNVRRRKKRKHSYNYYSNPYYKEISQLIQQKHNVQRKLNQLRQKYWIWN